MTVMSQMAKGLNQTESEADIPKQIERIKWCLWHGMFKGQQAIDNLVDDLEIEVFDDDSQLETKKLFKMATEFRTCISNNQHYIPNYRERWQNGEAISTGFVESTVNQVISKRFVKKQQMRWTPKGAHLLLQVRISVLNEQLQRKFKQWYPGLKQAA
jgi:hypothetical protein